MSKPVLTLASDLHLAHHAWARYPALWGDSYYALKQIVDFCVEHGTPLMLAGDILDSAKPDPETVWRLRMAFERMQDAHQPVYCISGQHDRAYPSWMVAAHPWVTDADRQVFTAGGLRWYALNWRPAGEIQAWFPEIPLDTDALMVHQVWEDLMGTMIRTECRLRDVPHVRLVLSGDYHKHVGEWSEGANDQLVNLLSPGSMAQQAVDEPVEKFFFTIRDDGKILSVPLRSRVFRQEVLSGPAHVEGFLSSIGDWLQLPADGSLPEELRKPAMWIKYDATVEDVYRRLTTTIGDRAHLFLSPIIPAPSEQVVVAADRRAAGGRLVDSLKLVCAPDSGAYKDASRLLESADAAVELAAMRTESGL